jgi:hypothetical protein
LLAALDDPNASVQEAVMRALDIVSENLPRAEHNRIQVAINKRRRAVIDTHEPFIAAAITHKNTVQKAFQVLENILVRHGARLDGDTLNEILTLGSPDARNELPLADPHWEENLPKPANPQKLHELAHQELARRK